MEIIRIEGENEKEKYLDPHELNNYIKKIVVVKDNIKLWRDENGIVIMGIQEFLLNKDSLDL